MPLSLQVVRYDLPRDVSALEAYACGDDAALDGKLLWSTSGDGRDTIVFGFGKHKGVRHSVCVTCPFKLCSRLLHLYTSPQPDAASVTGITYLYAYKPATAPTGSCASAPCVAHGTEAP